MNTSFHPVGDVDDDEEEEDKEDDDDKEEEEKTRAAVVFSDFWCHHFTIPVPAMTSSASPASTIPGDNDMKSGNILLELNDSSDVLSDGVRVQVTFLYRPERSDGALDNHCFAYNIRITNESERTASLGSEFLVSGSTSILSMCSFGWRN